MAPPKSDDDLYRQTSQFRIWSFKKDELAEIRRSVNTRAVEGLRKEYLQKGIEGTIEFLTAEEEYDLVMYYCVKAQDLAGVYKLPSHVKATAISFLKRFYLRYSVMEYHPKNIVYTCLFLATKAENHFISIENFTEPLQKVTPAMILDLEFIVAQALSFTLMVHHAFNAIHGYFLDLQSVYPDQLDAIGIAHDTARKYTNESLFSDAAFLFTPPQIALGALSMSNEQMIAGYLRFKFPNQPELLQQLTNAISNIREYILRGSKKLEKERAMAIDKKLYFCRHPDEIKKRKAEPEANNDISEDTKRIKA
ncbi:cyclin-like protein [Dipodascopsis uninucleata]